MRYDGSNLEAVLEAHLRWLDDEIGPDGAVDETLRADFSDTDMRWVNLHGAVLYGAIMRGCNMCYCDLSCADLRRADLTGVNWFDANLYKTRLMGAINVPFVPLLCPDTGEFTAWKKVRYVTPDMKLGDDIILKILIPADAERSSNTNRECRATKAKVLEMQTLDGQILTEGIGASKYRPGFFYVPGETVSIPKLGDDRFDHMSEGIFFYLNRQEAVEYLTEGTDKNGELVSLKPLIDALDDLNLELYGHRLNWKPIYGDEKERDTNGQNP